MDQRNGCGSADGQIAIAGNSLAAVARMVQGDVTAGQVHIPVAVEAVPQAGIRLAQFVGVGIAIAAGGDGQGAGTDQNIAVARYASTRPAAGLDGDGTGFNFHPGAGFDGGAIRGLETGAGRFQHHAAGGVDSQCAARNPDVLFGI